MKRKGLNVMEKREIEKIVGDLLLRFGYNDGTDTYVDITKLAHLEGFKVGETSLLPFKEDGFISISKDKKSCLLELITIVHLKRKDLLPHMSWHTIFYIIKIPTPVMP